MPLQVSLPARILLQCITLGDMGRIEENRDMHMITRSAYNRAMLRLYDRLHDSHLRSQYRSSSFLSRGNLLHLPKISNPFASRTHPTTRRQAAQAHALMESSQHTGKILLRVS